MAGSINQPEVDSPGVNSDRRDTSAGTDSIQQIGIETDNVPMQGASYLDRSIRKAVNLLECDPVTVETARHGASGFGAKVRCEQPNGLRHS
jgi:hypothetical protein